MESINKLSKQNKINIGIAFSVIFIIIYLISVNFIISFIGSFIVLLGILSYLFVIKKEKINSNKKKDEKIVTSSENAINSLIILENKIALSGIYDQNPQLTEKLNHILDDLYYSISKMNEYFGESSITYEIYNLASEHFPNRILAYLSLSKDNRIYKKDEFYKSLEKIEDTIYKTKKILEDNTLNKDERENLLIKIKY